MQEYRQSQKEKWEKERSPSPHNQRKELTRSKSPSSKPKTPEKVDKEKQRHSNSKPTTPPSKGVNTNGKNKTDLSASPLKTTKIQLGETLIHETVQAWHSSYLYAIKHLETHAEAEKYLLSSTLYSQEY
jgi:hypothetical protein